MQALYLEIVTQEVDTTGDQHSRIQHLVTLADLLVLRIHADTHFSL